MVEERLRNWIDLQRTKGKTELEIYNLLLKNGYTKENAGRALEETKRSSIDEEVKKLSSHNKKRFIIFIILWAIIFLAWLAWGYFMFFKN